MVELNEYAEMFAKNPLAHVVLDGDLRIILLNEGFEKLVGFNKERLLGMPFTDFKTKSMIKYLEDSGESVADAVRMKRMTVGESRLETPVGVRDVIRTNIPLLDKNEEVVLVYVTYNEITDIKNAMRKQEKIGQYMAKEVAELSKVYGIMAQGDLTPRYVITEPDQDTKEVYDQLIALRDAVRGIIVALQTNIKDVNKRMNDLIVASDTTMHSADDASISIQQMAQNANQLGGNAQISADNIEQISKAMEDMSAAVEEITSNMDVVSQQAFNATSASKEGAVLMEAVSTDMADIDTSAGAVYVIVGQIQSQMTNISKIIQLIRDLANQTNLLALNAAIEAARAGEHGRGFAVVASEVKLLAQESRTSAEKIEDMIKELNDSTIKASEAMDVAKDIVEKGTKASHEAMGAFKRIQASIESVSDSASEVAAASEEQAATTEEITSSIQEVADLIEKTAKEAGEIAAATEESAAAIDEINRMIQAVNTTAVEATEANRKFKVE